MSAQILAIVGQIPSMQSKFDWQGQKGGLMLLPFPVTGQPGPPPPMHVPFAHVPLQSFESTHEQESGLSFKLLFIVEHEPGRVQMFFVELQIPPVQARLP